MKHLSALLLFASGLTANATVRVITCQNSPSHFLPVTMYANVGDTIHWTWVAGSHVVGPIYETDIPATADTWNGWINSANLTYDYVVTVPGDYHYVCHPQNPHGEDGYLVVSDVSTGVTTLSGGGGARIYPSPFTDQFTVESCIASSAVLHDLLGNEVASFTFTPSRSLMRMDLGGLPKGLYLCTLLRNGMVLETKRLVKE